MRRDFRFDRYSRSYISRISNSSPQTIEKLFSRELVVSFAIFPRIARLFTARDEFYIVTWLYGGLRPVYMHQLSRFRNDVREILATYTSLHSTRITWNLVSFEELSSKILHRFSSEIHNGMNRYCPIEVIKTSNEIFLRKSFLENISANRLISTGTFARIKSKSRREFVRNIFFFLLRKTFFFLNTKLIISYLNINRISLKINGFLYH